MMRRTSHGFTMLEVLISIVIIAFGLLGVAGLQAFALKNNHSASLRLTATTLAADMIDRMRVNHEGVSQLAYHSPNRADYNTANPGCLVPAGACSPAQLAQHDRFEWQTRIAAAMPNGAGIVCLDTSPNDGVSADAPGCEGPGAGLPGGDATWVIKIWWTDDRGPGASTATPQLFWTAFNP